MQTVLAHMRAAKVQARSLRKEVVMGSQPLNKKIYVINTPWQRDNRFSPMYYHWVYQSHVRAGLMLMCYWPTQNQLSGIFVDFLFHFALFRLFFFLFGLDSGFDCLISIFFLLFVSVLWKKEKKEHEVEWVGWWGGSERNWREGRKTWSKHIRWNIFQLK